MPTQKQHEEYISAWNKLDPELKRQMAEHGIDGPLDPDERVRQPKPHAQVEADAMKLAYCADSAGELEIAIGVTPFHELLDREERELSKRRNSEEMELKVEAVSAILAFLFKPFNGTQEPTPFDVTARLFTLCYTIRPDLIRNWPTLESIAACFDSSKQTFSKRLIEQNKELLMHGRNQKTKYAVSKFREGTQKWWDEKKAAEKRATRKAYMAAYRAKKRNELNARHREYYEANKERILKQQKQQRRKRDK